MENEEYKLIITKYKFLIDLNSKYKLLNTELNDLKSNVINKSKIINQNQQIEKSYLQKNNLKKTLNKAILKNKVNLAIEIIQLNNNIKLRDLGLILTNNITNLKSHQDSFIKNFTLKTININYYRKINNFNKWIFLKKIIKICFNNSKLENLNINNNVTEIYDNGKNFDLINLDINKICFFINKISKILNICIIPIYYTKCYSYLINKDKNKLVIPIFFNKNNLIKAVKNGLKLLYIDLLKIAWELNIDIKQYKNINFNNLTDIYNLIQIIINYN